MSYTASWRSPSNIALIKYWGKHELQLPGNPSLSFTLSACHTNMTMTVRWKNLLRSLCYTKEVQNLPLQQKSIHSFQELILISPGSGNLPFLLIRITLFHMVPV
jgi:hypothetical protein